MRWREGWRWWWRCWRRVRTHENMQHVSQDVCFKMDPGTSQSLSLLLLCWRCPLQHHTSAHARTCTRTHARTHTCTRTHVHECIHAGLIQREEKNHKNVLLGHQASPLLDAHVGLQFILQYLPNVIKSWWQHSPCCVSGSPAHIHTENRHIFSIFSVIFSFLDAVRWRETCLLNLLIKKKKEGPEKTPFIY